MGLFWNKKTKSASPLIHQSKYSNSSQSTSRSNPTNTSTSSIPVSPKNPMSAKNSPSNNIKPSKTPSNYSGISNSLVKKVLIKRLAVAKADDFSLLRQNLLDGNIMIVNMQPLVENTQDQLAVHNQLNWLKQYCVQTGGSVAKLKENLYLVTPHAQIKVDNQFSLN